LPRLEQSQAERDGGSARERPNSVSRRRAAPQAVRTSRQATMGSPRRMQEPKLKILTALTLVLMGGCAREAPPAPTATPTVASTTPSPPSASNLPRI
jgi:hypothetical protein